PVWACEPFPLGVAISVQSTPQIISAMPYRATNNGRILKGQKITHRLWLDKIAKVAFFPPWLCHSDARQVSDLPSLLRLFSAVLDRRFSRAVSASQRLAAHRSGRARP